MAKKTKAVEKETPKIIKYDYVESSLPVSKNEEHDLLGSEPKIIKYIKTDVQKLFIRVDENGKPIGHPIADWNMRLIFEDFDKNPLPKGFEPFKRILCPEIKFNEELVGVEYIKIDGVWQDKYIIRELSEEELSEKQIKFTKE